MIKAAIFDLDGLLIDSEPLWDETDKILLARRGFVPSSEVFMRILGTGQKNTMEIFKKEFNLLEDTDELIEERTVIFEDLLDKNLRLMDGALELIAFFKRKKMLMAIATGGHTKERVIMILKKLNIIQYFSVLVSSREDVEKGKPHPDIYFFAAKKLNIHPQDCLVLEDAPSGIEAGRRAGMRTFGVNKIPLVQEKLKKAGADGVFASLEEIKPEDIP